MKPVIPAITTGLFRKNLTLIVMLKVAHAVLFREGKYVLQLRDDIPTITGAGKWALFGGKVEDGEDAPTAVIREVKEELCVSLNNPQLLWAYDHYSEWGDKVLFTFFEDDITEQWGQHRLTEGQAVDCFTYDQLADLDVQSFIREILDRHYREKSDQEDGGLV